VAWPESETLERVLALVVALLVMLGYFVVCFAIHPRLTELGFVVFMAAARVQVETDVWHHVFGNVAHALVKLRGAYNPPPPE
jgi:membrane-anchored glycerophosphoryl diester phosphodiesterase (GDPDase)